MVPRHRNTHVIAGKKGKKSKGERRGSSGGAPATESTAVRAKETRGQVDSYATVEPPRTEEEEDKKKKKKKKKEQGEGGDKAVRSSKGLC